MKFKIIKLRMKNPFGDSEYETFRLQKKAWVGYKTLCLIRWKDEHQTERSSSFPLRMNNYDEIYMMLDKADTEDYRVEYKRCSPTQDEGEWVRSEEEFFANSAEEFRRDHIEHFL